MVDIRAEKAPADQLDQIAVSGGDHPEIGGNLPVGTQRLIASLLQNPQQLGLQFHRHIADLVEQQGAAPGLVELTAPIPLGPGEGPPDMAEEFTLQQVGRHPGTVDRHEVMGQFLPAVMDGAGQHLLAHSALPVNGHGGHGAGRHLAGLLQHPLHAGRSGDDILKTVKLTQAILEPGVLLAQPPIGEGFFDHRLKFGAGHRLEDIVVGPLLD